MDTLDWQRITLNFPRRITLDVFSNTDIRRIAKNKGLRSGDQIKIRLHLDDKNAGSWRQDRENILKLVNTVGLLELHGFELVTEQLSPMKTKAVPTVANFDDLCKDLNISAELIKIGKDIMKQV